MGETLTAEDPMSGFDPNRTSPQPLLRSPAPDNYEFDPQKEITPLGGKFFDQVENDPRLSRSAKTRIQSSYLDGMDNIQEQRQKIESERMRSLMDRQRLEQGNMALAEMRRRQSENVRQAEVQKTAANALKGIVGSNLPPEEQRKQIAAFKLENAASIHADPALKYTVDAAESAIPVPLDPLYSTKQQADMIAREGMPTFIATSGNPTLMREWREYDATKKKLQSQDEAEVKEARKKYSESVGKLADFTPSFIPEDKLPIGVSDDDPNRLKYLTPETQDKGRKLVAVISNGDPDVMAQYETLSDAERMDFIKDAQIQLLLRDRQIQNTASGEAARNNRADNLVFGKREK